MSGVLSRLGGVFRVSRVRPDFLHGPGGGNINVLKLTESEVSPDGVGRDQPAGPIGRVVLETPDTAGTAAAYQEHQAHRGSCTNI